MTALEASYAIFAGMAVLCFAALDTRKAALTVWLGGWLLLPVAHYPEPPPASGFPIWIIGGALPSDLLIQKSWIAPCIGLALTTITGWGFVRALRPSLIDLPIACWCFWPIAQSLHGGFADPEPLKSALFLAGSWGAPWLLGRILFSDTDGRILLLKGFAISALALVPLALFEQAWGPALYEMAYQRHPFRTDGSVRYFGFRPILLFEHGNQFGIYLSLAALAAGWLAATTRLKRWIGTAVCLLLASLAVQSVGAIVLLLAGVVALFINWQGRRLRLMMLAGSAATALLAGLYLSGIVPLDHIARQTPVGRQALNMIRATGRGSIAWRISQDQKALRLVAQKPFTGSARWDWWRPAHTRPWGLMMLIIGQFGLVGLFLALSSPFIAGLRALLSGSATPRFVNSNASVALGLVVLLAMIDALLNAFILLPLLVFAGAIGGERKRRRQPSGGQNERA